MIYSIIFWVSGRENFYPSMQPSCRARPHWLCLRSRQRLLAACIVCALLVTVMVLLGAHYEQAPGHSHADPGQLSPEVQQAIEVQEQCYHKVQLLSQAFDAKSLPRPSEAQLARYRAVFLLDNSASPGTAAMLRLITRVAKKYRLPLVRRRLGPELGSFFSAWALAPPPTEIDEDTPVTMSALPLVVVLEPLQNWFTASFFDPNSVSSSKSCAVYKETVTRLSQVLHAIEAGSRNGNVPLTVIAADDLLAPVHLHTNLGWPLQDLVGPSQRFLGASDQAGEKIAPIQITGCELADIRALDAWLGGQSEQLHQKAPANLLDEWRRQSQRLESHCATLCQQQVCHAQSSDKLEHVTHSLPDARLRCLDFKVTSYEDASAVAVRFQELRLKLSVHIFAAHFYALHASQTTSSRLVVRVVGAIGRNITVAQLSCSIEGHAASITNFRVLEQEAWAHSHVPNLSHLQVLFDCETEATNPFSFSRPPTRLNMIVRQGPFGTTSYSHEIVTKQRLSSRSNIVLDASLEDKDVACIAPLFGSRLPWFRTWLAFHVDRGLIDQVFVYQTGHLHADLLQLLQSYPAVAIIDWRLQELLSGDIKNINSEKAVNDQDISYYGQYAALQDCLFRAAGARYAFWTDHDSFLVPREPGTTLKSALDNVAAGRPQQHVLVPLIHFCAGTCLAKGESSYLDAGAWPWDECHTGQYRWQTKPIMNVWLFLQDDRAEAGVHHIPSHAHAPCLGEHFLHIHLRSEDSQIIFEDEGEAVCRCVELPPSRTEACMRKPSPPKGRRWYLPWI